MARTVLRAGAWMAACVLAASCSGGGGEPTLMTREEACAAVPGCEDPRYDRSAPTETVWRVQVIRDGAGEVRIGEVGTSEVQQGDGVPVPPLTGSHLLAGLDSSGEPVDGQVIAFPDHVHVTREDHFVEDEIDLDGRGADTVGYVRTLPEIAELGVIDESGEVVATAPLPEPEGSGGRGGGVGEASAPLTQASPACAHVHLLDGESDRGWVSGYDDEAGEDFVVVQPRPVQRAVVEGALGLMTPLLCHSISRIAFVRWPDRPGTGGVVKQLLAGDFMLLNVSAGYEEVELAESEEQRLGLMKTIIHEAGHNAEAILNAVGMRSGGFAGDWTPPQRSLSQKTIDNVRLEVGFNPEWRRLHRSFVSQGWALPYANGDAGIISAVRRWEAPKTAESGFMSRYGAKSYAEDIAELVAWPYMARHYRAAGIPDGSRETEDFGCQQMREHGERSVPARLVAVYTKLKYVEDLGLVHPEDVSECIGDALGLPTDSDGFHIWQDGSLLRSLDRSVEAVIGTHEASGRHVFEMQAEGEAGFGGETHPATFRLQLDLDELSDLGEAAPDRPIEQVAWPRGVYPLATTGTNKFELRLDGAPSGDFDVSEGYALVAEADNGRIAGSVFITEVWRLNAPVPVPEVYDPPLIVRFMLEN